MRFVGVKVRSDDTETVRVARAVAGGWEILDEVARFWSDPLERGCAAAAWTAVPGSLELAPPVRPDAKVVCVGLNFVDHAAEGDYDLPGEPTVFARWTSTLSVSGTPVPVPPGEDGLDWEVELLVVVGRTLTRADRDECQGAVYGYATFNDITARRAQKSTSQWTLGKNADASGAMGPIVTADEVPPPSTGLRLTTTVGGELMQDASTADLVFDIPCVLSHISRTVTLRPGDLVAMGTPQGVGYARTPPRLLHPGDEVVVEVEGLGAVRTPIVAPDAMTH